jgi:hypothetical protein
MSNDEGQRKEVYYMAQEVSGRGCISVHCPIYAQLGGRFGGREGGIHDY